jgi:hypothetical protein
MKKLIPIIALFFFCSQSFSQNFSSYAKTSEFEAQRFLMDEVYEISSTQIDTLRIDFTHKEIDPEGFIFRLTSYEFNGNLGLVITTMNTYDVLADNIYKFKNIHLTREEFEQLNRKFISLEVNHTDKKTNLLQRFNERFIFEVAGNPSSGTISYNLWIENKNRHNFRKEDWATIYKRFQDFVDQ